MQYTSAYNINIRQSFYSKNETRLNDLPSGVNPKSSDLHKNTTQYIQYSRGHNNVTLYLTANTSGLEKPLYDTKLNTDCHRKNYFQRPL